jgi:hypothetical protein
MLFRIILLLLLGFIAVDAAETEVVTGSESRARPDELETIIRNSRTALVSELNAAKLSPEERAIRIERWQRDHAPLFNQARAACAALVAQGTATVTPNTGAPVSASGDTPDDPIRADIHAIETGFRNFRKSLEAGKPSPERRAIQVEQFLQVNRESLTELMNLKRQAMILDQPSASYQEAAAPSTRAPVPERIKSLRVEMDRITRDLAATDPETRAEYLETHASTLKSLGNQMLHATEVQANIEAEITEQQKSEHSNEP